MSSTVEDVQYWGGRGDSGIINALEGVQHCGDTISAFFGDALSAMEGYHQYCGGCSVLWRNIIRIVGAPSANLRMFSTVKGYHQCC